MESERIRLTTNFSYSAAWPPSESKGCLLSSSQSKRFSTALSSFPGASSLIDSSFVDYSEGASRDIAAMDEWAAACGVQRSDGFQLVREEEQQQQQQQQQQVSPLEQSTLEMNIGVATSTDISAGQAVLMVPNNMILSGTQARQEIGAVPVAEELLAKLYTAQDHLPQFYLMVQILKQYQMGPQSPWFPWLNSLPRYFSNGSSMTHFCCSECLPPLVGNLANQERLRFIQFFKALQFVDRNILTESTKGNRPLVKWVFAVVYTRCTTFQGDAVIVPMADMFNHGSIQPNVEIQWDGDGNCYAVATQDIPAGSSLRACYGDPTNPSYLFARYGFLDESSPATFCKIMISNPSSELLEMGYDPSRMLFYKDTGDVSQEVWDVLLYQILGDVDPTQQQVLYRAHTSGDYNTKQALHNQYYQQTSSALLQHIDTFVNQLNALSKKQWDVIQPSILDFR
ncbi:SET methyltransferase domain containing protein [Nitzschia inconspicua]|uniref:SET methyltransferase domain containing protein n=1 Tax=Nitzschia inconspicua TaxID=303405 RepID=A0A9K3K5M8_9STRA|nr:SET methyltransferase domain containing protein [Nitzschia inconspicua]